MQRRFIQVQVEQKGRTVLEKRGDFPIAESVAARTIALPFYNGLEKGQVEYIVHVLNELERCS